MLDFYHQPCNLSALKGTLRRSQGFKALEYGCRASTLGAFTFWGFGVVGVALFLLWPTFLNLGALAVVYAMTLNSLYNCNCLKETCGGSAIPGRSLGRGADEEPQQQREEGDCFGGCRVCHMKAILDLGLRFLMICSCYSGAAGLGLVLFSHILEVLSKA